MATRHMFVRQGSGKLSKIRTKVFPGPQNLALFVAEAKGYFDKHEIDADVQITVGSDEQRTALADGCPSYLIDPR